MDIEDCRTCFFNIGETGNTIFCSCFGEHIAKIMVPGAYGLEDVLFCPLDFMYR
jgi:hypothetical protein